MGLFDKLLKKENVSDDAIVAPYEGELIDIKTVPDSMFAEEIMGKSAAFKFKGKVTLCSPANGTLGVLFPTGHAFGIIMNNGTELLVHCGIDTVNANGDGFKILNKKQGDLVKAGDPIVEVDIDKLSKTYDMSTMLVITNANNKEYEFISPGHVTKGQSIIK